MHNSRMRPLKRIAWMLGCALIAVWLAGCEEAEVKKYTAAREKQSTDQTRLAGYKLPEGWVRLSQPVELSVASFETGEGKDRITITVSRFPGQAGGLIANIERWRGKVGMAKADEKEIRKEIHFLLVDGEKTPYVDLKPAKAELPRILGAVAERGSVTWFFKMQGPPDPVGKQQAAFESFVQSVRFGGNGANNE